MESTPRARISNRGGDYVRDVHVSPLANGHILRLHAPDGAVDQIRLTDPRYVLIDSSQPRRLRGGGQRPTAATSQLLTVLRDVVTLPGGGDLDYALAVDWYKEPVDGVASVDWRNTTIGDLVHRAKYWYKKPEDIAKLRECGWALVDVLVPVVNRHPLLREVDVISAVPGHDSNVVSFGARLAAAVANALGKQSIRCTDRAGFRTPAKSVDPAERADMIRNRFRCAEALDHRSVLIVDDVYSSGTTATETARALRVAGATRVASLCAVRTLRF